MKAKPSASLTTHRPALIRSVTTYPDGTKSTSTMVLKHPAGIAEPHYVATLEHRGEKSVSVLTMDQANDWVEWERSCTLGPARSGVGE